MSTLSSSSSVPTSSSVPASSSAALLVPGTGTKVNQPLLQQPAITIAPTPLPVSAAPAPIASASASAHPVSALPAPVALAPVAALVALGPPPGPPPVPPHRKEDPHPESDRNFSTESREDHTLYGTIMGLVLAATTYLIAGRVEDRSRWWYILLSCSIFCNLAGILGVVIASWTNYARPINGQKTVCDSCCDESFNCCQDPEKKPCCCGHMIFHFILSLSVVFAIAGTIGALYQL